MDDKPFQGTAMKRIEAEPTGYRVTKFNGSEHPGTRPV